MGRVIDFVQKMVSQKIEHHEYIRFDPTGFRITPHYIKYELKNHTLQKITGYEGIRKYQLLYKDYKDVLEDPKNKDQRIPLRILSPVSLPSHQYMDKLIIHIHGGG